MISRRKNISGNNKVCEPFASSVACLSSGDTTFRSHLIRTKDAVDPAKQGSPGYPMNPVGFTSAKPRTVPEHAWETNLYPILNGVKFINRVHRQYEYKSANMNINQ